LGKRSRRREHEAAAPEPRRGGRQAGQRRPSRSEAKDAAARAKLVPLREGERPGAVTVAAIVAALLGLANLIWYAAGAEIGGRRPAASGVLSYSVLMGVAAWGMWRAKYWAVLGMQAILVIAMMLMSLLVLKASDVVTVLICLAIIVPSGFLFWFLVKALARIQMPERRPR
jgi:hypothetical protein